MIPITFQDLINKSPNDKKRIEDIMKYAFGTAKSYELNSPITSDMIVKIENEKNELEENMRKVQDRHGRMQSAIQNYEKFLLIYNNVKNNISSNESSGRKKKLKRKHTIKGRKKKQSKQKRKKKQSKQRR